MCDLVSVLFRELQKIDIVDLAQRVELPKFDKINSGYIMEDVIRRYIHSLPEVQEEFDFNLTLENFISSYSNGFQLENPKNGRIIFEIDDILTNDGKNLNLIEIKSGIISEKYFNSKLRRKSESKTDISSILNSTKNFGYNPKLIVIYNETESKVLKKSIKSIKMKHSGCVTFLPYSNQFEYEIHEIVNNHNYKIDKNKDNMMKDNSKKFGFVY